MSNALGYGLTLNTGTYFGGGYTGATQRTGASAYNNRVASSTNLNRISRDLAQGYMQNMSIIDLYLKQGNINQALASYDSLLENVKQTANAYGYQLTDAQISSALDEAYQKATGNSFTYTIADNTKSPFLTGLIEGIPVVGLFANGNSNAEALAKLDGTEVREVDKISEGIGAVLSNAGAYAAIGALGGGVGIAIGAVAGAVVGLIKCAVKGN